MLSHVFGTWRDSAVCGLRSLEHTRTGARPRAMSGGPRRARDTATQRLGRRLSGLWEGWVRVRLEGSGMLGLGGWEEFGRVWAWVVWARACRRAGGRAGGRAARVQEGAGAGARG